MTGVTHWQLCMHSIYSVQNSSNWLISLQVVCIFEWLIILVKVQHIHWQRGLLLYINLMYIDQYPLQHLNDSLTTNNFSINTLPSGGDTNHPNLSALQKTVTLRRRCIDSRCRWFAWHLRFPSEHWRFTGIDRHSEPDIKLSPGLALLHYKASQNDGKP